MKPALALALLLLGAACADTKRPAVEVGHDLFRDPDFSPSQFNHFSCATCHAVSDADAEGRLLPGYRLDGAARRLTYWGGAEDRLLGAVNSCLVFFMRGNELDMQDEKGRALYEYLTSITPAGDPTPGLPFTIVHIIEDTTAAGSPARGETLYRSGCQNCHGAAHTGRGKLEPRSLTLPEEAEKYYDENLPGISHRLVFIEKLRHGPFFGIGGEMPLFSAQALSDDQIADILAYLGVVR